MVELHRLPCEIHHNGEAPIKEYFNTDAGTSSFRGRLLKQTKLAIPENYTMVTSNTDKDGQHYFKPVLSNEITQWHHDDVNQNLVDTFHKAFEYADLMRSFVE